MLELGLFYTAATISLVSTVLAVTRYNAAHALIYLIISLLASAIIFYLVGAPFAAVLEIVIYAGAIMVLFVFVIMLLNLRREAWTPAGGRIQRFLFIPAALAVAAALLYALVHHRIPFPGSRPAAAEDFGSVEEVGRLLFTDHLFAFEFASLLLVVAMIGAVVLAKRRLD